MKCARCRMAFVQYATRDGVPFVIWQEHITPKLEEGVRWGVEAVFRMPSPEYLADLLKVDPIERKRMADGEWREAENV